MQLYFHGGKCCGIKTIADFTWGKPTKWDVCPEQEKQHTRDDDAIGFDVHTAKPFFTDKAPRESPEDRLTRLIAFCKRRRPQGVIEVVLAGSPTGLYNQWGYWEPILFEHGFKLTCGPFTNSNTGYNIKIYHLVYDERNKPKASNLPEPFGRS